MKLPIYLLSLLLQDVRLHNAAAKPFPKFQRKLGRESRIVGGDPVETNEYPWFARLIFDIGVAKRWGGCGGSLISPRVVLTAAHCLETYNSTMVQASHVEFGRRCVSDPFYSNDDNCGHPVETINVTDIILHPGYNLATFGGHDVALMFLAEAATVDPVPIDDGGLWSDYDLDKLVDDDAKGLYAVGFGMTDGLNDTSDSLELMDVKLDFVDRNTCNTIWNPWFGVLGVQQIVSDDEFCAGALGKDSCNGDSGGPLYNKESNVLVGLTSWGSLDCSSYPPGVYAKVGSAWCWIMKKICEFDPDADCSPDVSACNDWDGNYKLPQCEVGKAIVTQHLITDNKPIETSLNFKTSESEQRFKFGPFDKPFFPYSSENEFPLAICVSEDSCNTVVLRDSSGDGIDTGMPLTSYQLAFNGTVVAMLPNEPFENKHIRFGACPKLCKPKMGLLRFQVSDPDSENYTFKVEDALTGETVFSTKTANTNANMFDIHECVPRDGCYKSYMYKSGAPLNKSQVKVIWLGMEKALGVRAGEMGSIAFSKFEFGRGCKENILT